MLDVPLKFSVNVTNGGMLASEHNLCRRSRGLKSDHSWNLNYRVA